MISKSSRHDYRGHKCIRKIEDFVCLAHTLEAKHPACQTISRISDVEGSLKYGFYLAGNHWTLEASSNIQGFLTVCA
ncbi:hypothetical protein TNCT_731781 [Trichonephila clavata]|uniref:Uncharacterized protein n=1 Tax=Trichonephila clavata TaxID=2740835 RepID=A0A8X6IBN8_TRICU|nr:hypothetical protein TNCT_731781 [Trichonephila clavata]